MEQDQPMWAIHGGRTGDADSLFLREKRIALGWSKIGDLSKLSNRESIKAALAKAYPASKPGAIPVNAGQLFRFAREAKVGDLVIYPSRADRQVHIGHIRGEYDFRPEHQGYPQQRKVDWLRAVPRTHFSQGALHELGSAMSFFSIKSYGEEFRNALDGKADSASVSGDETIAVVADETIEQTSDFILKKLAQELKGHPFEEFVAHLLQAMGYRTRRQRRGKSADGGIDIIAHRDELGFEPPIIKVQVKSREGTSGDQEVKALYGNCHSGEFALFVTLGIFSNQAKTFAENKPNLRLIDGADLVALLLEHYEELDGKYKGVIPLKRLYVPDPEQAEE